MKEFDCPSVGINTKFLKHSPRRIGLVFLSHVVLKFNNDAFNNMKNETWLEILIFHLLLAQIVESLKL